MLTIIEAIIKDYFLLVNWLNNSVTYFEDTIVCFRIFLVILFAFAFIHFSGAVTLSDSSVQ